MNNWRYRLMQFMQGRRGMDQLGLFLVVAGFVVEMVGNLMRMRLVYYLGLAMFGFALFRMLSKNIYKREAENQKFQMVWSRFTGWKNRRGSSVRPGPNYQSTKYQKQGPHSTNQTVFCIYYCPACKQQVRIPAGKGKVRVTCPTCKEKFEIVS